VNKLSENVQTLAETLKVLAGKGSDIVVSFEDLTLDVIGGRKEATPKLSMKLKGSIRLDIDFVKE
jgi:hypothetical protein